MVRNHMNLNRRHSPGSSTTIFGLLCLALTILPAAIADKTAADYFVHSLPGQPDGPFLRQHAGHIEVNSEHNGNLFFWHYQNRHIADKPRTVIWLNGGPGCSSEDGALMEIGPYRVREGGKLEYNEGSWDQFANLLFVDNPVGTGFSYVNTDSYLHELQEMADQFIAFLEKWYGLFPDYELDDLYIAGESYAGQHIPYIAKTILERNAKNSGKTQWNLKGLLIGNGWISPAEQYQAYLPMAYEAGLIQGGTPEAEKVEKAAADCLKALAKPGAVDKINIGVCESILNTILEVTSKNGRCVNMYDVRLDDSYPSCGMNWPPDLETVTPYLRSDEVTTALHINPEKRTGWSECSGAVSSAFRAANSIPAVKLLPALLEKIPILLFSGAKDMICTHIGTESFLANMKWNGRTGFETSPGALAPKQNWTFEGEVAGYYQEARNLTYVLINNSSHMVPFDYPKRSLDMLNRFMGVNSATVGGELPNSHIGDKTSKPPPAQSSNPPTATATATPGIPNDDIEQQKKLHAAELKAYYRAGEAALVVVIIGAALFGLWVWRGRRNSVDTKGLGSYMTIPGVGERFRDNVNGHAGGAKPRDLEAADFDESELDNLPAVTRHGGTDTRDLATEHTPYDLASDSDEDDISHDGRGRKV